MNYASPAAPSGTPSRSESALGRIEYLDGWRAIAIISVLIGHFTYIGGINFGRFGVELFFVLSGRLMAEILFVKKQPLGLFLKRRVARVWPALFVFVAIAAIIYPVPLAHILGAATFTQNYISIYVSRVPELDHLWSLSIEEWSYLFLAMTAAVIGTSSTRTAAIVLGVVALLCVTNGIVQTFLGGSYDNVYWRTGVRGASIMIGAVAFLCFRTRSAPLFVPIVAGIAGLALNLNAVPDYVKYSIGTTCLAVSLATLSSAPDWSRAILSNTFLRRIGVISFSLYLWQQVFYELRADYPRPLLLLAALTMALASYYLVETPARTLLNRTWAKRPASAARSREGAPLQPRNATGSAPP